MKSAHIIKLFALLFALGFLLPNDAMTQKKVSFGLMVGPEFNYVFYSNNVSTNIKSHPRVGFIIEGHSQFNFNSHLSLDIGLGYAMKRAKRSNEFAKTSDIAGGPASESNVKWVTMKRSNNLQLPILMKYYFGSTGTRFFVGLGVNSVLTLARFSKSVLTYENGFEERYDYNSDRVDFNISPQASIGCTNPIPPQILLNTELYGSISPSSLQNNLTWTASAGLRLGVWF